MAKSEVVATAKKAKSAKQKSSKPAPQHPKVAEMVNTAISTLKERGGSSLQAIKKYIASRYKVDVKKISPFVRKYLINSVESGSLIQTKGKGASGSFKMAPLSMERTKSKYPVLKAKKAAKSKTPKNASATKSPNKSQATKPKPSKSKKISGVMSCHGSVFAPRKSEIINAEGPKSKKIFSRVMKIDGTKAPIKKSENVKPGASKSKKTAGIKKTAGTRALSMKTKK